MKIAVCFLVSVMAVWGKNLGQYGPVFPIAEEDLMGVITQKLGALERSGQLAKLQVDLQQKMTQKIKNPPPTVRAKALSARTWVMDPSLIVSGDLMDGRARVFAKKGTRVRPSVHVPFGDPLVFIDGEDADQVAWGMTQKGRLVLTNGAPLEMAQTYKRPVYFDQDGRLTTTFQIRHVPAIVAQDGPFLKIDEVVVPKKEGLE